MANRPLARRLSVALAAAVSVTALAPADASAAPVRKPVLAIGDKGPQVRVMQRQLARIGFRVAADGHFGPATRAVVRRFEVAHRLKRDGRLNPRERRVLRLLAVRQAATARVATEVAPAPAVPAEVPGDVAALTPAGLAIPPANAPEVVKAIIRSGNRIARKPYRYGGGHGSFKDSGYDCSGSVSYALHGAGLLARPMASGGFMSWGDPGPGKWVAVYANPGHMYMVVAGLRFDTSARKSTGSRWSAEMRSPAGYRVRNP